MKWVLLFLKNLPSLKKAKQNNIKIKLKVKHLSTQNLAKGHSLAWFQM